MISGADGMVGGGGNLGSITTVGAAGVVGTTTVGAAGGFGATVCAIDTPGIRSNAAKPHAGRRIRYRLERNFALPVRFLEILFELVLKAPQADTQEPGRFSPVAADLLQRPEDVPALDFTKRQPRLVDRSG